MDENFFECVEFYMWTTVPIWARSDWWFGRYGRKSGQNVVAERFLRKSQEIWYLIKNADDQYYREFRCRQYCLWCEGASSSYWELSLEIWEFTNFHWVFWTFFWIWGIIKVYMGWFLKLDTSLVDFDRERCETSRKHGPSIGSPR